jgi:hypothetical protein
MSRMKDINTKNDKLNVKGYGYDNKPTRGHIRFRCVLILIG